MRVYDTKLSVTSGELSPLLYGRGDLSAYDNGAKELTNMIVLPQGGFSNRPGTFTVDREHQGARIMPFVVNTQWAWVLSWKNRNFNNVIDLHNEFGRIPHGRLHGLHFPECWPQCPHEWRCPEDPYPYARHPFSEAQLRDVRYLQSVDVMFIFHSDHRPMQITRVPAGRPTPGRCGTYTHVTWWLEHVNFSGLPQGDYNVDHTRYLRLLETSVNAILGASWNFFSEDMVGMRIRLEFLIPARPDSDSTAITLHPLSVGAMPYTFFPFGPTTIRSLGSGWDANINLYRNNQRIDSWDDTFAIPFDSFNYTDAYRLENTGNDPVDVVISWQGGMATREVIITEFEHRRGVVVVAANDVPLFSTPHDQNLSSHITSWSLEEFGEYAGWPSVACFHQNRLILANNKQYPTTIWMSQANNWFNFSQGSGDTGGITIQLATKQANEITAMTSREDLLIFTRGAEFVAMAGTARQVLTPGNVAIVPASYHGSDFLDVEDIGQYTLYSQRHGNVLRAIGFRADVDGYNSTELSILSSHLFENKRIMRMAYQQVPWSICWIVLNDGQVLALTMNEEHQVVAWTRNVFNNVVRDIVSIPGPAQQDDIYMICGNNLVMMHRRDDRPFWWHPATFLDEGVGYTSVYESLEFENMRLQGTFQGRNKIVPNLTIRMHRTSGFFSGIMTENSDVVDMVQFMDSDTPGYAPQPYSGDVHLTVPGGNGKSCRLKITNSEPTPLTIIGMWKRVEVENDFG